jgi:hypothetical protein
MPAKNPTPLLKGWHGASKFAWTTECAGPKNWNSTSDPTGAVMVSGLNFIAPLSPTVTTWISVAAKATGTRRRVAKKSMLNI